MTNYMLSGSLNTAHSVVSLMMATNNEAEKFYNSNEQQSV